MTSPDPTVQVHLARLPRPSKMPVRHLDVAIGPKRREIDDALAVPSWLVGKCLVGVLAIGRRGWKTLVCEGLG